MKPLLAFLLLCFPAFAQQAGDLRFQSDAESCDRWDVSDRRPERGINPIEE